MISKRNLSAKLNFRGLSKQQEAFARSVADGMPPTEAAEQIYPDNTRPSRYARELLDSTKETDRIEVLEIQRNRIRELNRDSLTISALDVASEAREDAVPRPISSMARRSRVCWIRGPRTEGRRRRTCVRRGDQSEKLAKTPHSRPPCGAPNGNRTRV